MEFFTTFDVALPAWMTASDVSEVEDREVARTAELADAGHLLRLWMPAAPRRGTRIFGMWQATDADELQAIVDSLPMHAWTTVEIIPLGADGTRLGAYIPELAGQ